MAQAMFDVCGKCGRPAKKLVSVVIQATNETLPREDEARTIGYDDLMCPACWKRAKRFVERAFKAPDKEAETKSP